MFSPELLNTLRKLKRSNKLYIMQILISELAQEETDLIQANQSYPVDLLIMLFLLQIGC